MLSIDIDCRKIEDYRRFLKIKSLPSYRIVGHVAYVPDAYARDLGIDAADASGIYDPTGGLFDYQRDITRMAIDRKKFCVFADCGLGKTRMLLEFARTVRERRPDKSVVILSPPMVVDQTVEECESVYGGSFSIERVKSTALAERVGGPPAALISNYEAMNNHVDNSNVSAVILDESSVLKSHYGNWASECIRLGRGIEYKLCLTGTPAPNDRIEYANHAVFMDAFPNVNSFLARFFVNRGQTGERWELKSHALRPFYTALSHWSIFLANPARYGWKDNISPLPPIHTHLHQVSMTREQQWAVSEHCGELIATRSGGITSRGKLAQIGKGIGDESEIPTLKYEYIRNLRESFKDESTITWCLYNEEQDRLRREMPFAESIDGSTPHEKRMQIIRSYKRGECRDLLSKPKILGFGLNLQVCTRMIFSGLQDSYESYYQAVKRANRYGARHPLNVHIPAVECEMPMIETVLSKRDRIAQDTNEQEELFAEFWKRENA